MSTAGRTNYASYHDQFAGGVQMTDEQEQWTEMRARELAGETFDKRSMPVRDWLRDAIGGEESMLTATECEAARDCYIEEHYSDYLDDACADLRLAGV